MRAKRLARGSRALRPTHRPRRLRDVELAHAFGDDLGPQGTRTRRALAVIGLLILAVVAAELVLVTVFDRSAGAALWRGVSVEMFAGREAGIPLSLGGGAPPWLVAQISATQDIGVVAIAYPLFLWLLARYHDRENLFMRRLRKIEASAAKHEEFVTRWGPLGVFLFMLIPFLLNGPLIGAILGRLCGLTTRVLIIPVVAATTVAAFAWTYFYDGLFRLVDDIHPAVPPVLTGIIVGGLVGWQVLSEVRELRRERKADAP